MQCSAPKLLDNFTSLSDHSRLHRQRTVTCLNQQSIFSSSNLSALLELELKQLWQFVCCAGSSDKRIDTFL